MLRFYSSILFLCLIVGCKIPVSELPTLTVNFVAEDGKKSLPFDVEVAATEPSRRKGLMYRKLMEEHHGMLFLFPQERLNSFWMKNTILELDMLFVSKDWRVVGILDHVPPQNEAPRKVDEPSQYVIELVAGATEKFGIKKGMKVVVTGELPAIE